MVKRILRKHGYPPDKQKKATDTVLEQANVIAKDWAETSSEKPREDKTREKPTEVPPCKSTKDLVNEAVNLNNLAGRYYAQGKFSEAMPLMKKSIDLRLNALGPDHPKVATGLQNLGTLYRAMGKNEEALPYLQRAVNIRESSLGPDHLKVAISKHSLGSALAALGRNDEALPLLQQSAKIREQSSKGKEPSKTLRGKSSQVLFRKIDLVKQWEDIVPSTDRLPIETPPATRIDEEKKIPQPEERIINTSFATLTQPENDIDKYLPLSPDTDYFFTFDIGELRQGSIDVTPVPLQMDLLPKEAKLSVAIFAFKDEIKITPGRDVGEIQIMPDWTVRVIRQVETPSFQPSSAHLLRERLFFPIRTPKKEGEAHLRCNIYCEQTLVQSRLVTASVSAVRSRSDEVLVWSNLEYSMSKSLNPKILASIKPQTLSVMLNEDGQGTHSFRMFGKDFKYERSFDVGTLVSLIKDARAKIIKAVNVSKY
jgi:tetratricopeptide (TPR) repeat protein